MASFDPSSNLARSLARRFNTEEGEALSETEKDQSGIGKISDFSRMDESTFRGVIPPTLNTASEPSFTPYDVESTKEDLLKEARARKTATETPLIIRAGGGRNPAVKA